MPHNRGEEQNTSQKNYGKGTIVACQMFGVAKFGNEPNTPLTNGKHTKFLLIHLEMWHGALQKIWVWLEVCIKDCNKLVILHVAAAHG
jgi:hypothetical protein